MLLESEMWSVALGLGQKPHRVSFSFDNYFTASFFNTLRTGVQYIRTLISA